MRIAVYTDYAYHRDRGHVYAERAFAVFIGRLADRLERVVLLGRLDPRPARSRYEIPDAIDFVDLPYYESLAQPLPALTAMGRSLRGAWTAFGDVDVVWLLGPNPLAIAFAVLAALRGKRIVLGVRSDFPAYVRSRHPGRRLLHAVGLALEGVWRLLARVSGTVVVGPELARRYRRARHTLELTVSLVGEDEVVSSPEAVSRSYAGELTLLSVGRLEEEKNPLMLADVLAELTGDGESRWRLEVCGEGELEGDLRQRLDEHGLGDAARLRGYVPFTELRDRYRAAHVLVLTSWTEGFPQVLVEAFAAGLPVVATDVGGIRAATPGAVILVPPGDPVAAAAAVRRIVDDDPFRRALIEAGLEWARRHTTEREIDRLTEFLESATGPARSDRPARTG